MKFEVTVAVKVSLTLWSYCMHGAFLLVVTSSYELSAFTSPSPCCLFYSKDLSAVTFIYSYSDVAVFIVCDVIVHKLPICDLELFTAAWVWAPLPFSVDISVKNTYFSQHKLRSLLYSSQLCLQHLDCRKVGCNLTQDLSIIMAIASFFLWSLFLFSSFSLLYSVAK